MKALFSIEAQPGNLFDVLFERYVIAYDRRDYEIARTIEDEAAREGISLKDLRASNVDFMNQLGETQTISFRDVESCRFPL